MSDLRSAARPEPARSILQMLRVKANTVLLVFAFLALIPVPPLVITGVVVMIIWNIHKKALGSGYP